jgi:hypothetical protein
MARDYGFAWSTRGRYCARLDGRLAGANMSQERVFGSALRAACPDFSIEILVVRAIWPDAATYDARAREIARPFSGEFQHFADVRRAIWAGLGQIEQHNSWRLTQRITFMNKLPASRMSERARGWRDWVSPRRPKRFIQNFLMNTDGSKLAS